MTRRRFLAGTAAAACAASLRGADPGRPPRILLRSSWQSHNIGDIGHTPGALDLLWRHFPEVEVTLWPGELTRELGHGSREMLEKAYPRLSIAIGHFKEGKPTTPALMRAFEEADLYLSGSGSNFPECRHAIAFHEFTGKPVGVFGVSDDPIALAGRDPEGGTLATIRERALSLPPTTLPADRRFIMDRAAFFFCRDTITRDYLEAQGVKTPILEFGPDAQLGMTLRDDGRGLAYLDAHGLRQGGFICVIPRLRCTPYWKIKPYLGRQPRDDVRDAINARTVGPDHAKLRDLIIAYVRATGGRVLACPEMTDQVELARTQLVDPLPGDVRSNVVWRDSYWLPDEAAAVYAKALAVISFECHSPLIALHNGTPTFYVRQPTDTCKGQMYRDIGADDWFFEIDETDGGRLWSRLEPICRDPAAARAKARAIMARVEPLQRRMVERVREAIEKTGAATGRGRP